MAFAPLEGIGHPAFLQLMASRGSIGLLCAPFFSVGRGALNRRALQHHVTSLVTSLVTSAGETATTSCLYSVQLLGADPARMASAARQVAATAAKPVAPTAALHATTPAAQVVVLDINFGCPARRVVARGAGAALLRDPEQVFALLRRVREAVPGTLSAKLRAGLDDSALLSENAEAVQAAGADFLTVHPRTARQGYRGVADWQALGELVSRLRIPVVGNGDCWYAEDAQRLLAQSGCAALMIGRPALRNPWIFEQLAALQDGRSPPRPDGRDLVGWLEQLAATLASAFARQPRRIIGKLKELLRYLGSGVLDSGAFRREALRAPDTEALLSLARERLAPLASEQLDLAADGPHRLMRTPQ